MAAIRKGYADTPMGQVHYQAGASGAPLLLLHMTPQSSHQFDHAFEPLSAAGLRPIAPDIPGYGASDTPLSPPSIEEYTAVLPHVLDHLGVERVAVAGHHTGASIACELANAFPDRVSRVVMHGVPWYSEDEREQRLANLHVDATLKEDGSHLTDRWNWIWGRVGGRASMEACQMGTVEAFVNGEEEWYCHQAGFRYDMDAALKALQQPTLVVTNTGDPLHYVVAGLRDLRPDFEYRELEGGTVFFIWDEGPRWASAVADFVKG